MKKRTKKILLIAVSALLLVSMIGLIVGLAGRNKADEGFEIVKPDYERGGLDSNGKYIETKASVYTKEAFDCGTEVRVKLDFDSDVTFKVFFYGEDDDFIESTNEYEKTATVTSPEGAVCARIVVTPEWDNDVKTEDQIVRVWNVGKYAKQLTVMIAPFEDAE